MQYTYEGLLASVKDASKVYWELLPMGMELNPENIYTENWIFVSETIPQKLGNVVAALSMQAAFEVPKAKFWQRNKAVSAIGFMAGMTEYQSVLTKKLTEDLNSNVKLRQALQELEACHERVKKILDDLGGRQLPPLL